jgi:hypothetical protein
VGIFVGAETGVSVFSELSSTSSIGNGLIVSLLDPSLEG